MLACLQITLPDDLRNYERQFFHCHWNISEMKNNDSMRHNLVNSYLCGRYHSAPIFAMRLVSLTTLITSSLTNLGSTFKTFVTKNKVKTQICGLGRKSALQNATVYGTELIQQKPIPWLQL